MQNADSVDVPLLGPTLGAIFGAAQPAPAQLMLRVEAAQILARSGELQNILINAGIDPDRPPADPAAGAKTTHRGGFTLLIDMENERIRYAVWKRVGSATRIQAGQRFMGMAADGSQSYFDVTQEREPFAMLHRGE
jgi:hypothetical protein